MSKPFRLMRYKFLKFLFLLGLLTFLTFNCDTGLNGQLEYADFLLDDARFEEAINLLDVLNRQYPQNPQLIRRLASAHLAHAILVDDRSYLALVADYFEEKDTTESDFQHFSDKSPTLSAESIDELALARRMLDEDIPDAQKTEFAWLQLGFARMLEINAIGVIKTGALSDDNFCNADPSKGPDGVPDEFDSTALTSEEETQFNTNVDRVGTDFENAGLSSDMSIIETANRISDDLQTAGSVQSYLDDQFDVGSPCPP